VDIPVGSITCGIVTKKVPGLALIVQLSTHTYGRVFVTDIYDEYKSDPLSGTPLPPTPTPTPQP